MRGVELGANGSSFFAAGNKTPGAKKNEGRRKESAAQGKGVFSHVSCNVVTKSSKGAERGRILC